MENELYTNYDGRRYLTRGHHMVIDADGFMIGTLNWCLSRALEGATGSGSYNLDQTVVAPDGSVVRRFKANREVRHINWKWEG